MQSEKWNVNEKGRSFLQSAAPKRGIHLQHNKSTAQYNIYVSMFPGLLFVSTQMCGRDY